MLVTFPHLIETEEQLDEIMTRPSQELVEFIKELESPLVILGAGGKMGPTLAVLACRAALLAHHNLEVAAVSRFTDRKIQSWLELHGVKTISYDLLDAEHYTSLPDTANVIYLVGTKFGTSQDPSRTWIMNTLIPAYTAQRYRDSRIAVLSTGNVYPLTDVNRGGSHESDPLTPIGEYSNACVGRERVFEYFSSSLNIPMVFLRLYYALDLRYGVLVDIAQKVYHQEPIDITMGYFNCIWQGDANELIIRSLGVAVSPPKLLNLAMPEVFSVRQIAQEIASLMGKPLHITKNEASTALIGSTAELRRALGEPQTPLSAILRWTAHWIQNHGRLLQKPTHFEIRDGQY